MRWRLRLRPRNWRLLLLTLLLLAAAVFLLQVAVSGFLEALSLREGQRNPRCDGPAIYCNPELRAQLASRSTPPPPRLRRCVQRTKLQRDPAPLLRQLDRVHEPWRWDRIRARVLDSWASWVQAGEDLSRKGGLDQQPVLQVLLVPGVLKATGFTEPDAVRRGAPAGDLQQWADLAAALHTLGHNVTLMDDFYHAGRGLRYGWFDWSPGPDCLPETFDRVFADIITMKTLMQDVMQNQKCRFHVVDAYGTEAEYNHPEYSAEHGLLSYYGGLGLNLKQFYTFFPHTPDNSFLGFAVQRRQATATKGNTALLYGKDSAYFQGKHAYIEAIMSELEVHATLTNTSGLPRGVANHGIVTPEQYSDLLAKSKVLVGVGSPLESTGALEALAHGCVFLNPRFTGNGTRILQTHNKPTSRKMNSQVPYLEEHVAPPHVYTVDTLDLQELRRILQKIKSSQVKGLVPREFSHSGMLQRVGIYVQQQDFCNRSATWPNVAMLRPVVADRGRSCAEQCKQSGLVCEAAHFSAVHRAFSDLHSGVQCSSHSVTASLSAPFFDTASQRCAHQGDPLLHSCAAGASTTVRRLCPCREKIHEIDP